LSLDGGGAKGFYTIGVLKEIEAMLGQRLCERFDMIFGTSTGAIIAALLALGRSVDEIHALYREHVPAVMGCHTKAARSAALAKLATEVFGDATFRNVRTGIGIVATRWEFERPMIFKGDAAQVHGRAATFVPGFGCTIADAIRGSCSAFPFFERTTVTTSDGNEVELIDGGYCANNPTLYAIADAVRALGRMPRDLRIVSVGVGVYPEPASWKSPDVSLTTPLRVACAEARAGMSTPPTNQAIVHSRRITSSISMRDWLTQQVRQPKNRGARTSSYRQATSGFDDGIRLESTAFPGGA
jgi:patatin-like phospholipase/acyl hydrolase